MKKILLWGNGNGYKAIMETALWKEDIKIAGIVETSKIQQGYVIWNGIDIPFFEAEQLKIIEFNYIIIANSYCGECILKALLLGIDIDQIINPCVISAYQDKESVIKKLSEFVENPDEIVEKLSNLYERKETKKCLIVGAGKDWDFFHAAAKWKKDVEVIGAFNYENREVIVGSNKIRMISEFEIDKIACDYFLVMDLKFLNYLAATDIHNMQKVIVPYTTGFENTKFEVVMRLNNILENSEEVVDYLSIRHTVGKGIGNMRPMKYDLIGYSLMNDRHTWENTR